jgi:3-deoxy-7-phosphoheptulonate synthase
MQTPADWSPSSWQNKRAEQQPEYPDEKALRNVLAQLSRLPPLVTSWEIEHLKSQLAQAQRGDCFLLQ